MMVPAALPAGGRFRNVDTEMTPMELSGQVFNLKNWKTLTATTKRLKKLRDQSAAAALA
jgi:hypothetical protein